MLSLKNGVVCYVGATPLAFAHKNIQVDWAREYVCL